MKNWNKLFTLPKNINFKDFLATIFILLISSSLIFYRQSSIPKNLSFDEIEFAKLALSLEGKPYTPYSPLATGHSTLYFYILLLSFKIFGINNFALRFPASFFGVLNVLVFYFILRLVYQDRQGKTITQSLPLLLSLIFLTSHWYLNFSRFAFEATFLLFLELTSVYFLLRTIHLKSKISFILSGLFAGLAFNSYTPGRIFFILPLFFLTLETLKTFKPHKLIYFLVPLIITIAPLSFYLIKNPDIRFNQQFFWKNNQLSFSQKINYTWQNIKSTALMFHFKGDLNGRHNFPGKPALNPILGVLFIIGMTLAFINWKDPKNLFFICYFIVSIIPTILTYPWENPNMLRTYTALPSIIFFIGKAIVLIKNIINSVIKNKLSKYLMLNTLLLLPILSCFYELRTYFKYQSKVFEESFEIKYPLEKAIKIKNFYEK